MCGCALERTTQGMRRHMSDGSVVETLHLQPWDRVAAVEGRGVHPWGRRGVLGRRGTQSRAGHAELERHVPSGLGTLLGVTVGPVVLGGAVGFGGGSVGGGAAVVGGRGGSRWGAVGVVDKRGAFLGGREADAGAGEREKELGRGGGRGGRVRPRDYGGGGGARPH